MTMPNDLVTFAMRIDLVNRLAEALRAHDGEVEIKEAQKEARSLETKIHTASLTSQDYLSKGEKKVQTIRHQAPGSSAISSDPLEEVLDPSLPRKCIGPFSEAIYHESGMFSTVYKARAQDGIMIALKVTNPAQMVAPHNSRREARILKMAASDHVVPLFSDFILPTGEFVLHMPFVPTDLARILQANRNGARKATQSQLRAILHDLFLGLAQLHSLGIIHRDIKPSNLLLRSASGPAYIADFGIAWIPNDPDSEPHDRMITDVGTTCYRPPELLFGHRGYGCALDLWAAGCVVAEAVASRHKPLFESGPLGSDLALVHSIFTTLGTPNVQTWPVSSSWRNVNACSDSVF